MLTKWLMDKAAKLDRTTKWNTIEVNLTDDDGITAVKEQVFGRREVTDVIALRYNPLPGMEDGCTAELFVNIQRAVKYHTRGNWDASRELALYLAHGCDHLAGSSDDTPAERKTMRHRELRWLREADRQNLTSNLLHT